ncbi:hypothetical protein BPABA577_01540 [Acinetobacter phage YMC13/03/R2096]|nr:hypothetical protein ACQ36_gp045 [Acinetobacter phage YMC13/03/R2096]AIW02888.1 hypothetical protein BPABA577_01540 [Acinetobacter phage YMC13/03/R2096]
MPKINQKGFALRGFMCGVLALPINTPCHVWLFPHRIAQV